MTRRGRALRLLRDSRGWTQTQMADTIGRAQAEVSRWEKGVRPVPDDVVGTIARRLGVSTEAFDLLGSAMAPLAYAVHHRSYKLVSDTRLRQLDAYVTVLAVAIDELLAGLDFDIDFEVPDLRDSEPEKAAELVRSAWRLWGTGPIESLVEVLEAAGVIIIGINFGADRVVGMSTISPRGNFVMLYNREAPWDRIRWTLAHELGHIVMHRAGSLDEHSEDEAHDFAGYFLMPKGEYTQDVRRHAAIELSTYLQLKPTWRVSMSGQLMHARRLGLISDSRYTSLVKTISARAWRTNEPSPIAPEQPALWEELLAAHRSLSGGRGSVAPAAKVASNEQLAQISSGPWAAV